MMVTNFYGHPYDVRELEAKALSEKVADCISYGGQLNGFLYDEFYNDSFGENFLANCNLNFETEDLWEEEQYYVLVEAFDINENLDFEFEGGNSNLRSACELNDEKDYETIGYCSEDKFYSTSRNRQFLIKITTVVGKGEKNV